MELRQCGYCLNKEECMKNHWCITFDNGYRLLELDEYKCDNWKPEKGVSYTGIAMKRADEY